VNSPGILTVLKAWMFVTLAIFVAAAVMGG
jgi:hypothetical protein